jgi:hypothetical protein
MLNRQGRDLIISNDQAADILSKVYPEPIHSVQLKHDDVNKPAICCRNLTTPVGATSRLIGMATISRGDLAPDSEVASGDTGFNKRRVR